MESLERWQRISLLSAFAQTVREALYSNQTYDTLASGTVRYTVDYVAQAIRDDYGYDPRLDIDGRTSPILLQQYKGYKVHDKQVCRQKAIPPRVLLELRKHSQDEENLAVHQLATGAWFFAMRSCEYSSTSSNEERKTKLLCVRNITFRRRGLRLDHSDPNLHQALTVTITFESQKNNESFESITMHRTPPGDPLCPVQTWAAIVKRILAYDGTDTDTPVNTFLFKGQLKQISSRTILLKLRTAVTIIGEELLGFTASEIGTHSIRSGAAMAMYLDNVPIFTIMLIGRWKSDAFLAYIRKQVEQFSHNVSTRMLSHIDWFTTPSYNPLQAPPGRATRDLPRRPQPQRFLGSGASRRSPIGT